jgi:GNAT superfamily N-acetyltransferase
MATVAIEPEHLPAGYPRELAIVVRRDWRRARLGRAMLACLTRAAIDRGYDTFAATFLADNHAVWRLLRRSGPGSRVTGHSA